jgi:hypothetical protein
MCIGGSIAFLVGAIGNWIWGSTLINVFEIMLTRIPGPLPDSPSQISLLAVFTVILAAGLLVLGAGLPWKGGDRHINLLGRIAYLVSAVMILLSVLLNLLAQFSARNIFYVIASAGSTPIEEDVSAIFQTLYLSIPSDYLLLLAGIVMVAGAVFGFARMPRSTATFGIASVIMGAIMSIVALIICTSIIYAAVCGMDINSLFTNDVTLHPVDLAQDLIWINRMAIVSKLALGVAACVLIIAAIIAPGKSAISADASRL